MIVRFPPIIHSSLKPCSKQLLVTNQYKMRVRDEIAVESKIAPMTFRHTFQVVEAKCLLGFDFFETFLVVEAECLLGFDFFETQKCDPLGSEMNLCLNLNRHTSSYFFHRTAPVQAWHCPVMRVIARETSFIPYGHEEVTLEKIDTDDHTLLPKKEPSEHSQGFPNKQHVLGCNILSEVSVVNPACIFNLREDRTIYKNPTLGTITILEAETLAQENVTIDEKQKVSAITK